MHPTFGFNIFDSLTIYHDRDQLVRSVKRSGADVFHVHNEPDWLVEAVAEGTDKPIIYDCHDLESLRWRREPDGDEESAFGLSAGWVHVSDPCKAAAESYHGNGKPNVVLPSYVNEEWFGKVGQPSWSSIVYQGGLSANAEVSQAPNGYNIHDFRYYVDIVRTFAEQGFTFYLFSPMTVDETIYENVGGVVAGVLNYPALMNAMRIFGFGFVGAAVPSALMDAAMPNKLFEYMSQGVVPVCYNAQLAGEMVDYMGAGIHLQSLDNLAEQLERGPECRAELLKVRGDMTMEAHIEPLIDLYKQVV